MANIRRAGRKRVLEHVRAASEVVGAGVLQLFNDERERHSRNRRCRSGEVRGPYCHLFLIWPLFTISTATRLYKKEASPRLRIKAPLEDVSPSRRFDARGRGGRRGGRRGNGGGGGGPGRRRGAPARK